MPAKADNNTLDQNLAAQAAKEAEKTGGETYTPDTSLSRPQPQQPEKPANACPDCDGKGIRNPAVDHQVCQTCEGRGTIA